jgi:TRAP-type C4-dicarboxylate transport system permease small subunit
MIKNIALYFDNFGRRLNWFVERVCALLTATMVIVIWFGVTERYFLELGITWTEEFSRYVMIWLALLAVSCGAYRREHIGLDYLMQRLSKRWRPVLRFGLDLLGLAFFIFLTVFGVGMTIKGATQYATIFGMTMVVPFASVPVSAGLTSIQIFVTMIRDFVAPIDLVENAP